MGVYLWIHLLFSIVAYPRRNNLQTQLNTLAPKPWVAGRGPGVASNGTVAPFARNGLQLFTCTRTGAGVYEISWRTPRPSGIEYSVQLSTSMFRFGIYSNVTPTSVRFEFYSIVNAVSQNISVAEDPGQFSFIVIP